VTIDHLGNAHVVFTHNPVTNAFGVEQGNLAYVRSTAGAATPTAPTLYSKWSGRSALASGFGAQFFPTVTAQKVPESSKPYVYVGWPDSGVSSRLGPGNANRVYEAKFRRSTAGGSGFGRAIVTTDHASVSDFSSVGDHIDSSAAPGIYHIAWTDNRQGRDPFSPREHLFADRHWNAFFNPDQDNRGLNECEVRIDRRRVCLALRGRTRGTGTRRGAIICRQTDEPLAGASE
jgi:hypothetical protein